MSDQPRQESNQTHDTGGNRGGSENSSGQASSRQVSASQTTSPVQGSSGFAPIDYTDNRALGSWESIYGRKAKIGIWSETIYLLIVLTGCLYGVYLIIVKALDVNPDFGGLGNMSVSLTKDIALLSFAASWVGGMLGGCTFTLKWMYHSVAKKLWHEDRRLWRVLTPMLCGVVSLATTLLISTNLLGIFDRQFLSRPLGVLAFSYLVGYFSDKALAKLAEVADTLFGSAKLGDQKKVTTDATHEGTKGIEQRKSSLNH